MLNRKAVAIGVYHARTIYEDVRYPDLQEIF